jgi:hypothetical protein
MTCVVPNSNSAIAAAGLSDIVREINSFRPSGNYSSLDLLEEHARAERPHVLLLQLTPAATLDAVRPILSAALGASGRLELALRVLRNIATGHASVSERASAAVGDKVVPFPIPRLGTAA